MAHQNLKTKKKKEYNPLVTRTIKTQSVGKIRCFIKVVKPNPKDVFGTTKAAGFWYNMEGRNVARSYQQAEQFDPTKIYFYEVGANDGSYRKCTSEEDALMRFGQLVEFEKRQTQIK